MLGMIGASTSSGKVSSHNGTGGGGANTVSILRYELNDVGQRNFRGIVNKDLLGQEFGCEP